jgi:hypothetical protein
MQLICKKDANKLLAALKTAAPRAAICIAHFAIDPPLRQTLWSLLSLQSKGAMQCVLAGLAQEASSAHACCDEAMYGDASAQQHNFAQMNKRRINSEAPETEILQYVAILHSSH